MKSENLIISVLGSILKMAAVIFLVYTIYRGVRISYDYGYRILNEPAMSVGKGRNVTISFEEGMSPLEVGEMMQEKGLSRDGRLFALQYLFSEYREDIKPGVYNVSTAMTAEEIMAVMAGVQQEPGNESGKADDN